MPRRTRLLITHVSMHFGGVETQLLALLRGLDCAEYEIHLALCHKAGEKLADVPGWVAVHDLKSRTRSDLQPVLALKIAALVARLQPDLCLSYHPFTNLGTHLGTRLAGLQAPTLSSFAGEVRRGRMDFLRAPILRRMSGLCCVGESVAASVVRCFGSMPHALVIPNCVDVQQVETLASEPVDHPWLTVRSCPVLVTVARLVPSKGIDFLLHSLSALLQMQPARLLVIGDGPGQAGLATLARRLHVQDHVDLVGYQLNPHKFTARCDAFIFGSIYDEGLPTALLEAMVCRTPVITVQYPGAEDAVVDGCTGLIVPSRDEQLMAEAISRALSSPDLCRLLREEGYARVLREFSKERYVQRYEQLFETLLDGRH